MRAPEALHGPSPTTGPHGPGNRPLQAGWVAPDLRDRVPTVSFPCPDRIPRAGRNHPAQPPQAAPDMPKQGGPSGARPASFAQSLRGTVTG